MFTHIHLKRGFAFIGLADELSFTKAQAKNNRRFQGRVIKVDLPRNDKSSLPEKPKKKKEVKEEEGDCKICFASKAITVFLPCKHLVACKGCAERLEHCPMCRSAIQERLDVYTC